MSWVMKASLVAIPIAISIAISPSLVFAGKSCPTDKSSSIEQCENPKWRDEAAYIDHNDIRQAALPDSVERNLVSDKITIWSLPVVSLVDDHYTKSDLEHIKIDIESTLFSSASATLNQTKMAQIDAVLAHLKGKPNLTLHIVGHTDNQRLSLKARRWFTDNQQLSLARAKAIASFLKKSLQLSDQVIKVEGKGSLAPIASNATPQGMAKNRRVEIIARYTKRKPTGRSNQTEYRLLCEDGAGSPLKQTDVFSISIDGKRTDKQVNDNQNHQRCTDVGLAKADMRIQYDNLSAKPMLNVSAWPATFTADEEVDFTAYSNYLAWIDRAEVRLFKAGQSPYATPLAIVPLSKEFNGKWRASSQSPQTYYYRLRVYDKQGKFDETTSLPLWQVAKHRLLKDEQRMTSKQQGVVSYGKTRLEKQQIPVIGGSVTVNGDGIPKGHMVYFMGHAIPVDNKGSFVARQIIPAGVHTVELAALDVNHNGALYWRDIEFKRDDWFYVGLIDVTAGRYKAGRAAVGVTKDKQHLDNKSFIDGRMAFYTTGKWKNKYTVTASADTREQPLDELFSTFMDKDPRSLLRRLDDTAYYPTYGDDSTLVESAPTQGKFYAKIEDERSHAMWGNFKIVQQETDLAQINRGLYGAVVDWNSESFNLRSDSNTHVNVFAAEPGTQAARDEFRGTGGSLYYLEHQDIVTGSERVQVEVRDKDSGIVLSVNTLIAGQDYQEDAIQGRILLTRALPSTADDSQLVRAGSYSGHPVFLVVDYEYVGTFTDFSDVAVGGRATHWLTDSVRLGVTGSHQQRSNQDQNLTGFDVLYSKTADTYLRIEAANTEGPGVGATGSLDGGLTFNPTSLTPTNQTSANAYHLESGFVFTDLGFTMDGNGHVYLRRRGAGFSAPGQLTNVDTDQFGGQFSIPLNDSSTLNAKLDLTKQNKGIDREIAEIDVRHTLNDTWSISAGLRADKRQDNGNIVTSSNHNDGTRADLAVQLDYSTDENWGLYGFGQGTIQRNGNRNNNNRAGLGGRYQLNDRLGLKGEGSAGSGGFGALVGMDYRLSERTTTYINYALDPDNANNGIENRQGKLVSGMRTRYSDWVSVYGEEQLLHGDSGDGLTHAYGVELTPNEQWKFGLALENGRINTSSSEVKRRAISLSADYALDAVKYGGNLEYRRDSVDGKLRHNWLTRNHLAYMLNPDWRLRLQLDLAISDSSEGGSFDADFAEVIVGYAYRPVTNDRLNALFEYKYLADQSPSDQFTSSGLQNDFEQRSHVLAVDAIYDLTPHWSVGGKYAIRKGQLRAGRGTGDWFDSTAQLGIVRLDWHVIRHWDALLEARVLDIEEADDRRTGLLAAIYRHFGDHLKVGVGYNFTDFSDDLIDLDYDSRGMFFNVVGKW